jgi:hypothetical protein
MSDINGGQYPNPNGSPIFPGTLFTGPVLSGNVVHSDGTGNLAGLGETSGTANVGYLQAIQTQAAVNNTAATWTSNIVIPAQSQITDIYLMVTTVDAAHTFSVGIAGGSATGLTNGGISLATLGQLNSVIVPTTAGQIANWDNVGNTDINITLTFSGTGAFIGTLSVFYVQGINNVS